MRLIDTITAGMHISLNRFSPVFPFHPISPFLFSSRLFSPPFAFAFSILLFLFHPLPPFLWRFTSCPPSCFCPPFCFLFGDPSGLTRRLCWYGRHRYVQVEGRPDSKARIPLVVGSRTQLGCCLDAGWVVSSALLFRVLLAQLGFVCYSVRTMTVLTTRYRHHCCSRQKQCAGDRQRGNAPTPTAVGSRETQRGGCCLRCWL